MWERMQNLNGNYYMVNWKWILFPREHSLQGFRWLPWAFRLFILLPDMELKSPLEKRRREFNHKMHLMEHALHADFAIVKAWKGDRLGNLVFRKTTRNFSTSMAKAGDITIAEVEELVEPGDTGSRIIFMWQVFMFIAFFRERIMKKELRRRRCD